MIFKLAIDSSTILLNLAIIGLFLVQCLDNGIMVLDLARILCKTD